MINAVRLMGSGPISGSSRRAWDESRELGFVLGE